MDTNTNSNFSNTSNKEDEELVSRSSIIMEMNTTPNLNSNGKEKEADTESIHSIESIDLVKVRQTLDEIIEKAELNASIQHTVSIDGLRAKASVVTFDNNSIQPAISADTLKVNSPLTTAADGDGIQPSLSADTLKDEVCLQPSTSRSADTLKVNSQLMMVGGGDGIQHSLSADTLKDEAGIQPSTSKLKQTETEIPSGTLKKEEEGSDSDKDSVISLNLQTDKPTTPIQTPTSAKLNRAPRGSISLSIVRNLVEEGEPGHLENIPYTKNRPVGIRFHLLLSGLFLTIFTAFLDHTILSAALAHIVSDFNALNDLTWLPASYMLTSTALLPIYGKLSDIFGRRDTLLTALFIFLVGSIMCGISSSMPMLIGSRAFCGLGGGGLIALCIIIISDIVPLHQRSLYLSMTGIFFIVAVVSGPVVGGFLSDNFSWRWNFYINIPISTLAMFIIYLYLKPSGAAQSIRKKLARVDLLGSAFIIIFTCSLLLSFNWGGSEFNWDSWQVLLPLCIAFICLVGFVLTETRFAKEPLLPKQIFNRNVISANITNLLAGFPFYVTITYIPIYYQVVKDKSATFSALELLPMMGAVVIISALAGYITTKTGAYRIFNILGTLSTLLGVSLLASIPDNVARWQEILYIILLGMGHGFITQNCTILSQAAVHPDNVASVTSLLSFTQSMGGVLGLAIIGSIYKLALKFNLSNNLANHDLSRLLTTIEAVKLLTTEEMILHKISYVQTLRTAYLAIIPFSVISFLATLFLIHIPLNRNDEQLQRQAKVFTQGNGTRDEIEVQQAQS